MKFHGILLLAQTSSLASCFVNRKLTSKISAIDSQTSIFGEPEVLGEEGTWQAFMDEDTTGLIYYFDTSTGESLWEPPTDTFPEVKLPRKKERLARELRQEYLQTITDDDAEVDEANWLSGLFEKGRQTVEESQVEVPAEPTLEIDNEEQSGGWFGNFLSGGEVEEAPIVEEEAKPETASRSIFDSFRPNNIDESASKDSVEEVPQAQAPSRGLFDSFKLKAEEVKPKEDTKATEKATSNFFGSFMQGGVDQAPPKEIEKKPAKQSETKARGMVDSFGPSVTADPVPKAKQPTSTPTKAKKKDPKIGGVVKKPLTTSSPQRPAEVTSSPIKIEIASNIIPHPAKVLWGGEDAVFAKGRTFGVFDGVSGAVKKDGVPLYSRTLANEMKKRVGNDGLNVQELTKYLTESADVADAFSTGASTAVVASIGENGFLQALNVGDSCCMVIRDSKIVSRTREINHYWDCPYQLSTDSPDRPKDGTKMNVELVPGDVILMGSDGVFDNLDDDKIVATVAKASTKAGPIAKKICDESRKASMDKKSPTPYSQQAQRRGVQGYKNGVGGKVDDIGCVVAVCK